MDGVFTLCRDRLPGCVRLDRHEGPCNTSRPSPYLRGRSPKSSVLYLARKLEDGTPPGAVAAALRTLAARM